VCFAFCLLLSVVGVVDQIDIKSFNRIELMGGTPQRGSAWNFDGIEGAGS
jgi:hypothetical protein